MNDLRRYEHENVRLVDTDGDVFVGYVGDYIYPEDNEPEGVESLVLDIPGQPYPLEFFGENIKSIEIISE